MKGSDEIHCVVPAESCYFDFFTCRLAAVFRMLGGEDQLEWRDQITIWSEEGDFVPWLEPFTDHDVQILRDGGAPPHDAVIAVCPEPAFADDWNTLRGLAEFCVRRHEPNTAPGGVTVIRRRGLRRYLEHDELVARLRAQDMVVREVELESLSPREQIHVMQATKILIGAHGAGLTNAVFLPRGALVVELFPRGFHRGTYATLSRAFNHACDQIESDAPSVSRRRLPARLVDLVETHGWPARAEIEPSIYRDREVRHYLRDVDAFSVNPAALIAHLKASWPAQWNACARRELNAPD